MFLSEGQEAFVLVLLLLLFIYFEAGSPAAFAGLRLTTIALNDLGLQTYCLHLSRASNTGMFHHVWLSWTFFKKEISCAFVALLLCGTQ